VHNLLLVDFPYGKSLDTSNVGCFFSILVLKRRNKIMHKHVGKQFEENATRMKKWE